MPARHELGYALRVADHTDKHGGRRDDSETDIRVDASGRPRPTIPPMRGSAEDSQGEPRLSEPPESGEPDEGNKRRRRLERILPEVLKRALERGLEAGMGTFNSTNETIRGVVGKYELPKELAGYVLSQMDETKNSVVRVVAKEVRDFLEATDLSTELQKVLTALSFEVKTEIRFIPNDHGGVRPEIKSKATPKRASRHPASIEPDE